MIGLMLALSGLLLRAGENPTKTDAPWPMYGGTPQRNMANLVDKNIITNWNVAEGKEKNVKWTAKLGSKAFGGPVIAGGRIFVGTNNDLPREKKAKKNINGAVLMAFNEADGKFLWQNVHEIPNEAIFLQFGDHGLVSTPVVEGDRLYYVTPSSEVICAATDKGNILWRYDMRKELNVVPYHCSNCAPLISGERHFLITGNGNGEEDKVLAPEPPASLRSTKPTASCSGKIICPAPISSKGNGPTRRSQPSPANSK